MMSNKWQWHKRMFCDGCDWTIEPSFGDPWFVTTTTRVCPECATPFYTSKFSNSGYTMKTVKWIIGKLIKTPWWKFNKFGPGHWEEEGKDVK